MLPTESAISSNPSNSSPSQGGPAGAGRGFALVLFIALCIEIGTFLAVVPWSEVWDRNWLVGSYPSLRPLYLSHYLRGAISGLGLVNLWLGVSQAWNFRQLVSSSEAALLASPTGSGRAG